MASSRTSEQGGDEPPPYSRHSDSQSARTNEHVPEPFEDRKRSSSHSVVNSVSRPRDFQTNRYEEREGRMTGRSYGSNSEASSSRTEIYRSNDYVPDAAMRRREFASNPALNSGPRPQNYQNEYPNGDDYDMGRGYATRNQYSTSDPQNQEHQRNEYMQQSQPAMGRTDYKSNAYAEPMMGRGYSSPNQAYTSDPRAQQYPTRDYMQRDQSARVRSFSSFGAMQDMGRGYEDASDYGGRRPGGRRGDGGILHRRRERNAERGGGLVSMGISAVTGMMNKK